MHIDWNALIIVGIPCFVVVFPFVYDLWHDLVFSKWSK